MATPKAPRGWSVEFLGLAHAVQFTNGTRRLMWSDGRWSRAALRPDGRWMSAPAPGVPSADTMQDARRVGCAFLREFEEVGPSIREARRNGATLHLDSDECPWCERATEATP